MSLNLTGDVIENCSNCQFWHLVAIPEDDYAYGICRRFPPKTRVPFYKADYPCCEEKDWCGEWKTKRKTNADN